MSQVLTIVANPRSNSVTRRLLQSFLTAYKRCYPADVITELDVYQCDIPVIDDAVIKAWDKPPQERLPSDCIFRFIRPAFRRYPARHSDGIRPIVPVRPGQPFRWDPANASFRMPALP